MRDPRQATISYSKRIGCTVSLHACPVLCNLSDFIRERHIAIAFTLGPETQVSSQHLETDRSVGDAGL